MHYPDLGRDASSCSMEFLCLFLRHHLAGKPVVVSPNVGCFLRLSSRESLEFLTGMGGGGEETGLSVRFQVAGYMQYISRLGIKTSKKSFWLYLLFVSYESCQGSCSSP